MNEFDDHERWVRQQLHELHQRQALERGPLERELVRIACLRPHPRVFIDPSRLSDEAKAALGIA